MNCPNFERSSSSVAHSDKKLEGGITVPIRHFWYLTHFSSFIWNAQQLTRTWLAMVVFRATKHDSIWVVCFCCTGIFGNGFEIRPGNICFSVPFFVVFEDSFEYHTRHESHAATGNDVAKRVNNLTARSGQTACAARFYHTAYSPFVESGDSARESLTGACTFAWRAWVHLLYQKTNPWPPKKGRLARACVRTSYCPRFVLLCPWMLKSRMLLIQLTRALRASARSISRCAPAFAQGNLGRIHELRRAWQRKREAEVVNPRKLRPWRRPRKGKKERWNTLKAGKNTMTRLNPKKMERDEKRGGVNFGRKKTASRVTQFVIERVQ